MITRKIINLNKCLFTLLILSTLAYPRVDAEELSKIPHINSEITMIREVGAFTLPADYPADLAEWYQMNVDARSYVVMDQETDRVLAQREGRVPYPIASLTKIISAYLVYQAIEKGEMKMDQMIKVPSEIADIISTNPELSNVGLYAGEEYSVKDLLAAVMIVSANDATSALMWELYGSEQAAVQAMTELVESWDIEQFKLFSVSGAPNEDLPESMWVPGSSVNDENLMSAADVAIIAKHLVVDYPQVLELTSDQMYVFKEGTDYEVILANHNQLLPEGAYGRLGITGLKSGYTPDAGKSFVASGNENGRDFIAVAMGTFGDETMSAYWEIEILLDGLLDYPDLYKDENLPVNTRPSMEELALKEEKEKEEAKEKAAGEEKTVEKEKHVNRRDNPLTNFMRNLFK